MTDDSTIRRFVDAYRLVFEAFDVPAIVDRFSFPCQVASEAGEVTVTVVPSREAWTPQIERLVRTYQAIGVRTAELVELRSIELGPGLAVAGVRWRLVAGDGTRLYEFDAAYTLADLGVGLRIVAIAHNELPQLNGVLERLRGRG